MKNFLTLLLLLLLLTSCTKKEKKIVISVNSWIGYTPLFYIQEMGWLKDLNIEIHSVVSLGESQNLYSSGVVDGFAATQVEYFNSKELRDSIPIILLDRSSGADTILSNFKLEKLKLEPIIDVYLEKFSVNSLLFDYFLEEFEFCNSKFNLINSNPYSISKIDLKELERGSILVTYESYSSKLEREGFFKIASTENINLLIFDALYIDRELFQTQRDKFLKFKIYIDRAVSKLKSDPKEYYEVVKGYLQGQTYEEFLKSVELIEWINEDSDIKYIIKSKGIETDWILK